MFKSAPHVAGVLVDPKTALSGEPNETAFNKAFNTDLTTWAWLEQPGQEYRLRVTGLGMNGVKVMQPANAILSGMFMVLRNHHFLNMNILRFRLERFDQERHYRRRGRRNWSGRFGDCQSKPTCQYCNPGS